MEIGVIRPAHGQAMMPGTELVKLTPRKNGPGYEAETMHRVPAAEGDAGKSGPSMVNSDDYRENWTRIFGSKPSVGIA